MIIFFLIVKHTSANYNYNTASNCLVAYAMSLIIPNYTGAIITPSKKKNENCLIFIID